MPRVRKWTPDVIAKNRKVEYALEQSSHRYKAVSTVTVVQKKKMDMFPHSVALTAKANTRIQKRVNTAKTQNCICLTLHVDTFRSVARHDRSVCFELSRGNCQRPRELH